MTSFVQLCRDYVVSSTFTSGGTIAGCVFCCDAFDCVGRCAGRCCCCCCCGGSWGCCCDADFGAGILGSWRRRLEGVDDEEAASFSPEFGRDDAGEAAAATCCGCADGGYFREEDGKDASFSPPPPPPPPPPPLAFLSHSGSLPLYCGGERDLDPAALAGPLGPRPLGDLVRLRGWRGIM